jgi:hypothetical protein
MEKGPLCKIKMVRQILLEHWARRQAMWIQPRKDPYKQWLQMHYCITKGDIDMIINEWPDEWRIPTIPREVLGQTVEGGTT